MSTSTARVTLHLNFQRPRFDAFWRWHEVWTRNHPAPLAIDGAAYHRRRKARTRRNRR